MRVPVNERVKDVPASALRAMFAGIGSLLGVTDRIRQKQGGPEAAAEPKPAAEPKVPATDATVAADTVAADTVAEPAASAEPQVTAESAAPAEPVAAAEAVAEPAALDAEPAATAVTDAEPAVTAAVDAEPAALPIANYDELSIASLRARLRNLSVEQLAALVTYEKGHAAREDVVAMFERRIAKVESEA